MKISLTILLTCCLVFGFIQTSNGQNLISQQKLKIENQVDSIFHEMINTAEKLDYDKLSIGVDDRYNAGFIVNGVYFPKYDSLANLLKANIQSRTKQSLKVQKEKITVLSDNIVLLTATGNAQIEINSNQSFSSDFLWSFVFQKFGNEWKVVQSHQSQANK